MTGSSGFIGRHLVAELKKNGRDVIAVPRYETDSFFLPKNVERYEKATIFHLAGSVHPMEPAEGPHDVFVSNVGLTEHILEFCRLSDARIIIPSTASYRDRSLSVQSKEDDEICAENPYSFSKFILEQICNFYCRKYLVNAVLLRLFNVYGPGQTDEFLIPWIIKQVERSKVVQVKDPESKRDFIFVSDVVQAFLLAERNGRPGECYNIGSGETTGVRELVSEICKIWELDRIPVTSDQDSRKMGVTRADISKARAELRWSPTVDLCLGLKRVRESMIS